MLNVDEELIAATLRSMLSEKSWLVVYDESDPNAYFFNEKNQVLAAIEKKASVKPFTFATPHSQMFKFFELEHNN